MPLNMIKGIFAINWSCDIKYIVPFNNLSIVKKLN